MRAHGTATLRYARLGTTIRPIIYGGTAGLVNVRIPLWVSSALYVSNEQVLFWRVRNSSSRSGAVQCSLQCYRHHASP